MTIPDFLGIGAQKAGTTWLYEHLRPHPDLFLPDTKELHFWDMHRELGLPWYLAHFTRPHKIQGEITPAYAILPPEIIGGIHRLNPALRLIYIVRDPAARAWSAALMEMGREKRSFNDTPDEWFLAQFHSEASRQRGDYKTCLENWLGSFPEEQLLLLRYEDIAARPREALRKCARHLRADPEFYGSVPMEELQARVFAGPRYEIRPALKMALENLYCGASETLEEFLAARKKVKELSGS